MEGIEKLIRRERCRNHAHKGSACVGHGGKRLCSREGWTNQTHIKGPSIEGRRLCPTNRISMALPLSLSSMAEKEGHYLTTASLSFDCIVHWKSKWMKASKESSMVKLISCRVIERKIDIVSLSMYHEPYCPSATAYIGTYLYRSTAKYVLQPCFSCCARCWSGESVGVIKCPTGFQGCLKWPSVVYWYRKRCSLLRWSGTEVLFPHNI